MFYMGAAEVTGGIYLARFSHQSSIRFHWTWAIGWNAGRVVSLAYLLR